MHAARVVGVLLLVTGIPASIVLLNLVYMYVPGELSEAQLWAYSSLIAAGVWLAFFATPAAVVMGTSTKATRAERRLGRRLFAVAAICCPLLQVAAEMVRGPWYGILGFALRAACANGFWFTVWAAAMKMRVRDLPSEEREEWS